MPSDAIEVAVRREPEERPRPGTSWRRDWAPRWVTRARQSRVPGQAPAGFRPDPKRLAAEIGGLVAAIVATVALATAVIG